MSYPRRRCGVCKGSATVTAVTHRLAIPLNAHYTCGSCRATFTVMTSAGATTGLLLGVPLFLWMAYRVISAPTVPWWMYIALIVLVGIMGHGFWKQRTADRDNPPTTG